MSLLRLTNVSKSFREYSTEWKRVGRWFGLPCNPDSEHCVLKNVSFEMREAESVGLVGENGAGKSTLLKVITGTLLPNSGSVTLNGRIAAILELGMGFNAELTGRQNTYHTAALMGFSESDIDRVIDEIEAFAEIGEYFDEPTRTYSSGMQVRVAFAVATAYRPEFLIVDEALSVGDAYFQHKCFDRIRDFRERGTTLLIASHDPVAIQTLCDRAILLDRGQVVKDAFPEAVFDFYNAIIADKERHTVTVSASEDGRERTRSGTGEACTRSVSLCNSRGKDAECIGVGEYVELRVSVSVESPIESLVLGYGIKDRLGQVMYGTNTWHTDQVLYNPEVGSYYYFNVGFEANLGPGNYSVQLALVDRDTHLSRNYEWLDLALLFDVVNFDKVHFVGCLWSEPRISVRKGAYEIC